MRLRSAVAGWGITILMCGAGAARASLGGHETAEPLGWDRATATAYFRLVHIDESGDAPTIVAVPAGRGGPAAGPLAWSVHVPEDAAYREKAARLRRTLVPLVASVEPTIPDGLVVLAADTLRTKFGAWPRFRVRTRAFRGVYDGAIEVTTYREPSVRLVRVFGVTGGRERFGIVSFVGIPFETGYERQVPVLLPGGEGAVVRIPDAAPGE